MKNMYLVQRARFNPDVVKHPEGKNFTGAYDGLITLAYMGSAEFEFGRIPASFTYVMTNFSSYKLYPHLFETIRGVPVNIFCRITEKDEVVHKLNDYLKSYQKTSKNHHRLKEYISFQDHMTVYCNENRILQDPENFWWDIQNHFMFFIGATDRQKAFSNVINSEYNNWWLKFSEEERKNRYERAKILLG